jgi:hypothetical protein
MKDKPETPVQIENSKERFTLIKNKEWKPPRKPQRRIQIVPNKDLPPAA